MGAVNEKSSKAPTCIADSSTSQNVCFVFAGEYKHHFIFYLYLSKNFHVRSAFAQDRPHGLTERS